MTHASRTGHDRDPSLERRELQNRVDDIGQVADGSAAPVAFLMVGLPGAGKTVQAKALAGAHRALLLTPDAWMIPLFGRQYEREGWAASRGVLEGRLIALALEALRLNVNVVLDFGLWGRDERSALHWLVSSVGASSQLVYMPVDRATQLTRVSHRLQEAPQKNFPMTAAHLDKWRAQFQAPDRIELAGTDNPNPPAGYADWLAWAAERWPSLQ